jgi:predicted acetyltransferase
METFGIATDAERAALAPMISHTFGFPAADAPAWFERAGYENLRALREGGLAGGLIVVPMGQYFGGRSVPMTGVAGVGVAPEHRGRGAGTRMMRALASRGYNRSLRGALTLHVTDDVIAENSGAFRLEVEGGEGRVTRAAGDGLAVDVRALATMYTGFRRASSLARDGLAHGDASALALADALFASEGPAMSDGF